MVNLLKLKYIIFVFILFLIFPKNSYSQPQHIENNNIVQNIQKLDLFLKEYKFYDFQKEIKTLIPDINERVKYLLSKQYDGYFIIYLELSNIYAENILKQPYVTTDNNKISAVKFYYYTGILLLEQDIRICHSAHKQKEFLNEMKDIYSYANNFSIDYPESKTKNYSHIISSISFINKLPKRPQYNWACFLGTKGENFYGSDYGEENLQNVREIANNEFLNKHAPKKVEKLVPIYN